MAREILFRHDATGATLYAQVIQPSTGKVRDVVAGAWDTPTAGDWGDYDIAMAEDSTTQIYTASIPAGLTVQDGEAYTVLVYEQSGASPATTDVLVGSGSLGEPAVASVTGAVGSVTGAVGSVTGAAGSVTGSVGSVVGNVGGNVVGSVASVTGAVGSVTGAVGSVTGNVGGNVVGSVASVVGNVGGSVASVTGNVDGNVTGSIGSLGTQAKADVNAEVDSALDTAVPGSPTANSINARVVQVQDVVESDRVWDLTTDPAQAKVHTYARGTTTDLITAKDLKDADGTAIADAVTPIASMVQP